MIPHGISPSGEGFAVKVWLLVEAERLLEKVGLVETRALVFEIAGVFVGVWVWIFDMECESVLEDELVVLKEGVIVPVTVEEIDGVLVLLGEDELECVLEGLDVDVLDMVVLEEEELDFVVLLELLGELDPLCEGEAELDDVEVTESVGVPDDDWVIVGVTVDDEVKISSEGDVVYEADVVLESEGDSDCVKIMVGICDGVLFWGDVVLVGDGPAPVEMEGEGVIVIDEEVVFVGVGVVVFIPV